MNKNASVIVREDSASPVVVKYADTYGPEGIDIRQHFIPKDSPEDGLRPTKKGARIPSEELPEFLAGVLRIAFDLTGDDIKSVVDAALMELPDDLPVIQALRKVAEAADEVTVAE